CGRFNFCSATPNSKAPSGILGSKLMTRWRLPSKPRCNPARAGRGCRARRSQTGQKWTVVQKRSGRNCAGRIVLTRYLNLHVEQLVVDLALRPTSSVFEAQRRTGKHAMERRQGQIAQRNGGLYAHVK